MSFLNSSLLLARNDTTNLKMSFKLKELLEATKGKVIAGPKSANSVCGISIDSRTIKRGQAFIAIKGDNFDGHDFIDKAIAQGAKVIIVHRPSSLPRRQAGIVHRQSKVTFLQVKDTTKALGDIARFHRQKFNIPVIAVTGSNGKTTTKEMIAWVLSGKFEVLKNEGTKNNHIGLPLALLGLEPRHSLAVLELGTNHFGEIEYLANICQPNIGVITNIGPSHLEYFDNLEGVFKEKYTLIRSLERPYLAVLNADDDILRKAAQRRGKRPFVIGFGARHECDFAAEDIQYLGEKMEFSVNHAFSSKMDNCKIRKGGIKYRFKLNTIGPHNIYNALAAITVARVFGLEYKDILRRMRDFVFLPGRLNLITLNNTRFIDDTYNANPVSLRHALDALSNLKACGKKIFVMGDMLELGGNKDLFHRQVGAHISQACDIFITVGSLSRITAKAAEESGLDAKNIFTCDSYHQARQILFKRIGIGKDDIVLVKGSRAMKLEEIFKI